MVMYGVLQFIEQPSLEIIEFLLTGTMLFFVCSKMTSLDLFFTLQVIYIEYIGWM